MFASRSAVGTRLRRESGRWLLVCSLLLAISSWLPASAQTSTPDTVVFPPRHTHLPMVIGTGAVATACPGTSSNSYETLSILHQTRHPRNRNVQPIVDPDLNLSVRGYKRTTALLGLVDINGDIDGDPPQLAHIFRPARLPTFSGVYQVYDWDWPAGKVGQPITKFDVTLVEMGTTPGEKLYPPGRDNEITKDFLVLVLYAEQFRLTFAYTREDTPADGYLVHVENLCVDPNLLALYEEMNAAGRDPLPTLRGNDSIGIAHGNSLLVAVRDSGSFMDPRSAKDWWQEQARALQAAQARP